MSYSFQSIGLLPPVFKILTPLSFFGPSTTYNTSPNWKHTVLSERWSPTFWQQGPVLWKTIFPQTGGGKWDSSGGNASDREWQMKLRLLARHSPPAVRSGS